MRRQSSTLLAAAVLCLAAGASQGDVDPACPLQFVLERPGAGFGHRISSLIVALELAEKQGAALYLVDDYWDPGDNQNRVDDYREAWDFIRVLPVSQAPYVPDALQRPRNVSMKHVLKELPPKGPGMPCGTRAYVSIGKPLDCGFKYCVFHYPGLFDRMVPKLRQLIDYDRLPVSQKVQRFIDEGKIVVIWHVRYGDIRIRIEDDVFDAMKARVDAELAGHEVEHLILVQRRKLFIRHHPDIRERTGIHFLRVHDAIGAFAELMRAHVLASTGSSYAFAAAALAPPGRQVHLMMPPKEARACKDPEVCTDDNKNGYYRGYFFSQNTVPLAWDGQALKGYEGKEAAMLQSMGASRSVPLDVADAHHEAWLQEFEPA